MKKRVFLTLVLALVVSLALFAFTACNSNNTAIGENLLDKANGDFEYDTIADDMTISYWHKTMTAGSLAIQPTRSSDESTAIDFGDGYLALTSKNGLDYVYQSISVDKKAVYELTFNLRLANAVTKGNGAYVTFKENMDYKFVKAVDSAKTANGAWKTYTFYVRPQNVTTLTLCLALDTTDSGSTSSVTAYYDNVSLTRVDESAVSGTIYNIRQTDDAIMYNSTTTGILFIVFLTLASVLFVVAAYVIVRRIYSKKDAFISFKDNAKGKLASTLSSPLAVAGFIGLGAALVRLILLLTTYGFGSSMTALTQLASSLNTTAAVKGAYGGIITAESAHGVLFSSNYSNIAPGALYILAIIGSLVNNSADVFALSALIRLVEVFADIAVVMMIYFYGRKYVGDKVSTVFAALYAVLPVAFVLSGIAGSFECMVVALTVAALLCMVEKKYVPMYVLITLAALLNIEALAVAPLMIAYVVYQWIKEDSNLKKVTRNRVIIPIGLVGSLILMYILLLPIAINTISASPFGGFTMLVNEMTGSKVFVNNAFNLYSMCGMNMSSANSTASVLNLIFILVLEIYVVSLYLHNRNKMELLMLASFTFAIIGVFTLKISYTYILLALALGFIYAMISGEKRVYSIMGAYSVLAFVCVAQLMNLSGFFVANQGVGQSLEGITAAGMSSYYELDALLITFSVFTVLVTLYYGYVSYSITNNEKLVLARPMYSSFFRVFTSSCKNLGTRVKDFFANKKKSSEN